MIEGLCICARVTLPLSSGSVLGFSCKGCGVPLQVTLDTLPKVKAGRLITVCHPCGFKIAQSLPQERVDFTMTRKALREMDKLTSRTDPEGQATLDYVTSHPFTCEHCGAHLTVQEAKTHECATE